MLFMDDKQLIKSLMSVAYEAGIKAGASRCINRIYQLDEMDGVLSFDEWFEKSNFNFKFEKIE